jgi:hypothetical protein
MYAMMYNLMLDWMVVHLVVQLAMGWTGPSLQTHLAAAWVLAIDNVA